MKRPLLTGFVALALANAMAESTPFDGLSGEALRSAVAEVATQTTLTDVATAADCLYRWLSITDGDGLGNVYDIFNGTTASVDVGGSEVMSVVALHVVDPRWWRSGECDEAAISYDLVNLLATTEQVATLRSIYPPGVVTDATYDNGIWSVGASVYDGAEINCYQPPKGYEGDFARIYFYMLVAHPAKSWLVDTYNFIASSTLPCLRSAALRQLLTWHRTDLPDQRELDRDKRVETLQDHYNPFVRYPDLVDYLFGDKLGETYGVSDATADPQPVAGGTLKPRYALGETIWLSTPTVPADASWTIDGVAIDGASVEASSLGIGNHILRFSSGESHGKILIVVE